MAKRSLTASLEGAAIARKVFNRRGWTQEALAAEVNLKTRQPIWRFFTCRPIERHTFIEICAVLDLTWEEIADCLWEKAELPEAEKSLPPADLMTTIETLRAQLTIKIQEQCSTLRLREVNYPVALETLYVDLALTEQLSSSQWHDLSKSKAFGLNQYFELNAKQQGHLAALDAAKDCAKLRLIGGIGSGKTTFLKCLALQCSQGDLFPNYIPILINLERLVHSSIHLNSRTLLEYIYQELKLEVDNVNQVDLLLRNGSFLVLLDHLDDLNESSRRIIYKEICDFSEKYYNNRFIVTSRPGSDVFSFPNFTNFEIADFSSEQIRKFAQNYFSILCGVTDPQPDPTVKSFIRQLELPENSRIRDLAANPLLLSQICGIFYRRSDFPAYRSDIYWNLVRLLLDEWNAMKGVQEDPEQSGLSLPNLINLIGELAIEGLRHNQYLFEERALEEFIANFTQNLSDVAEDPELLLVKSRGILRTIVKHYGLLRERSQGIYTFSHIAFQEYFAARKITKSSNLEESLENLMDYVGEAEWREVFLLIIDLLKNKGLLVTLLQRKIEASANQKDEIARMQALKTYREVKALWVTG